MMAGFIPAGWIFTKMDSRAGVAAAVVGSPAVADVEDGDPCEILRTGDWIRLDGTTGEIIVTRKD